MESRRLREISPGSPFSLLVTPLFSGFFTSHDPSRGSAQELPKYRGAGRGRSSQELFDISRVGPGLVRMGSFVTGRIMSSCPDPTRTDPTRTEPNRTEPNRTEPNRTEPTRPDPTRPDPTRPDPTRPDPTRPDPTRPDPTRAT